MPTTCSQCGKALQDAVAGQMGQFLGFPSWPCIGCDVSAAAVVVSDRGIIAERDPVIVIIRRGRGGTLEFLYGLGSIASPGEITKGGVVEDGTAALRGMKALFDAAIHVRALVKAFGHKDRSVCESAAAALAELVDCAVEPFKDQHREAEGEGGLG